MKWSIIGLFLLGIVAAVAAIVLMLSFKGAGRTNAPAIDPRSSEPEPLRRVRVLVANGDIEMRSVVDADDVGDYEVDEPAAPPGTYSDPVQVVGRMLVVPMKQGQAFTQDCFASDESSLLLASALSPGMRAVSVTLSDDMGMEKLLYPGCLVDVLLTVEMESQHFGKNPISFSLLEEVMVLAVGTATVAEGDGRTDESNSGQSRPPVTLLLEPDQAEVLKLGMERGSISLVLRNPMDDSRSSGESKSLARISPTFAEVERRFVEAVRKREAEEKERRDYEMERERMTIEKARSEAELALLKFEEEKKALEAKSKDTWEVIVLRGGEAQTQSFTNPRPRDQR